MSWEEQADCRQAVELVPELKTAWDNIDHGEKYLPDPQEDVAKRVCAECPVRELCVRDAVVSEVSEGIRGGYRFHMGWVSRAEAREIQKEFGIKARVKRGQKSEYVQDFNV